jgi:transposase-like protein
VTARRFTAEEDRLLAAEYEAGKTYKQLAAEWGSNGVTVRKAVLRAGGVTRRPSSGVSWSEEGKREAIRLYRAGMLIRDLARHLSVGTNALSDMLRAEGVEIRPGGRVLQVFATEEACRDLAERHAAGTSLLQLAAEYGCSTTSVKSAIKRAGGETRPPGRSRTWTPEVIAWAVAEYEAGRSQADIAQGIGVSQAAVSRRLRAEGVVSSKGHRSGPQHHSWMGGRSVDASGYVTILVQPEDLPYCTPNSSGRVPEHRLVMGRAIGRPLEASETVHHINGVKDDNRLENLQLRSGNHGVGVVRQCNSCGSRDIASVPL